MDEVILVDDDFEQLQALEQPTITGLGNGLAQPCIRMGGTKRAHNGVFIRQIQPGNTDQELVDPAQAAAVIYDGQDIFFIQEVDDDNDAELAEVVEIPLDPNAHCSESDSTISVFDVGSDEENIIPQQGKSFLEQEASEALDDCHDVDPTELSDIWNDLITANQEILILLELQDLKLHIIDARRIENQLSDIMCEFCPRILQDMRAWNRHIQKHHFQTEWFQCNSCNAKLKNYARLKDHLNGHRGDRVYQCDECNHQYAFRMGLIVHKILDHIKMNGIYVCPKCDLDCKNLQHYKLHIAKHIDFAPAVQHSAESGHNSAGAMSVLPAAKSKRNRAAKVSASSVMPNISNDNERYKFLNAFESFSQQRKEFKHLPPKKSKR
ncbi:PR domain zinc finger protein 4-like [Toxorhynchites rutilus septentrionalis]|uniref:PR domain zinc finger protein 4-like n=1 Tax=Toxorhynchites rutilus septentrionalis TaxID=329112 RepID=UPI00247B10B0|nr:PR domain zinc finger protein 4-like [Toxorhynchites rutilus septentrionalis]XP_055626639.1 PR domain zinc finger protein 4-like [Toxorhynchites rutilus septentrionalis]